MSLIEGQLCQRKLPPPAKPTLDYFPHLRKVAEAHRSIMESVAGELDKTGSPPEIRSAAMALLKTGHLLNNLLPKTREYLDIASLNLEDTAVEAGLDAAWDKVRSLNALRDSAISVIGSYIGLAFKSRVKKDLFNVVADELMTDLGAAIGVPEGKDRFGKLTHGAIQGAKRLLLIFDDYEALGQTLAEFLIGALIPRLAGARFETLMIVLGRDDIESTHPGWAQHCRQYIKEQIRLAPFGLENAAQLLRVAGIPEARHAEVFQATQGFPFLLSLVIEEVGADSADSALFLRKFFDRTSRWMSPREQDWFVKICYLERIDEDTLATLFATDEIRRVQDWFEKESSIRDPTSDFFRVRPLIRDKVLRYQHVRAPTRHRDMLERAKRSTSVDDRSADAAKGLAGTEQP
ncbi:MAG: hypothetical protein M3495_17120 [Pseudomonadota bacterium]|nr:hypothetical protein [Pseudomonadota bacterium]